MKLENNITYDLCVVGAGPAGIIVSLEYARLNPEKKILLIEYGYNGQSLQNGLDDSIKNMNPVNHHEPYESTNKGLGGSSATWGGRCVMYDKVDFIDRPIVDGGCTWDIALYDEMRQYLGKAAEYFECGDPIFNLNETEDFKDKVIAENFVEGDVTDSIIERWSMPTRFGNRYKKEIAERPNITFLDASEARDFSEPNEDGVISTLAIRDVKNKSSYQIKATTFVLAAGAQETTRILLRNPHIFNQLSGPPDALGKYYQGHLSGKIATVHFKGDPKKTEFGFLTDKDGIYLRRRFQFSTDFLVKNNLLNTALWLDNPLYYDPKHGSGPMSFMYLAMITPILGSKLAPPAIAQSITKGKVNGIPNHIFNIIKGLPGSLFVPAKIFYKRYCLHRKLPGVFLYSPQNTYALHFHSEQIPNAESKMELDTDGETLIIQYLLSDADIESIIKVHKALDQWLRKCNCGELEYWFKPEQLYNAIKEMSKDGIHQSGTTRLSNSPESGVVDTNLKVWGTKNMYICSSSVFPTSGQANPTFFLGAFGVRLAEFLTNKP